MRVQDRGLPKGSSGTTDGSLSSGGTSKVNSQKKPFAYRILGKDKRKKLWASGYAEGTWERGLQQTTLPIISLGGKGVAGKRKGARRAPPTRRRTESGLLVRGTFKGEVRKPRP